MQNMENYIEKIKERGKNFLKKLKADRYCSLSCIALFLQILMFILYLTPTAAIKVPYEGKESLSAFSQWSEESLGWQISFLGVQLLGVWETVRVLLENNEHKARKFGLSKISVVIIALLHFLLFYSGFDTVSEYKDWGAEFVLTFAGILICFVIITLFFILCYLKSISKRFKFRKVAKSEILGNDIKTEE